MIKKFLIIFLFLVIILCPGYKKIYKYTIDAGKDAFYHNNLGINYKKDRIYYAAIQEFKIAIQLSPNTQATAIFKNNLGDTYSFIGYPDMARICYEDAIKLYGHNFTYYKNLVECYIKLRISKSKITELESSKNPYDKILLGLLYIQTGERQKGIVTLDEFCVTEPNLIITTAIKNYLKEITQVL